MVAVALRPARNVLRLIEDLDPNGSLRAQSIAIGCSSGLVSTYGPLSQVAIAHGVSNIALYDQPAAVNQVHVDMTARFATLTGAQFTLLDTVALPLVAAMLSSSALETQQ